jgi:hypothetical protein
MKTEKPKSKIDLCERFEYKDNAEFERELVKSISIVIGSAIVMAYVLVIILIVCASWISENL